MFFSCCSQYSLFWTFDCMCLYVDLFGFILFGVHWAAWIYGLEGFFHQIWEVFDQYFFKYFFNISSSLCLFLMLLLFICLCTCWCPTVLFCCVHFSSFSFFSVLLNNLNWPIFKFSESFFCQFKSAVEPLHWTFHFSYSTFQV